MRATLVIPALFALLCACRVPSYDISASDLPRELQPVPKATQVIAKGHGGGFGVSYLVEAEYPAAGVLAEIATNISPKWVPRTEDSDNPGIPTSHVRGWTSYGDLTTSPPSWVFAWQSEWQTANGDLLSYSLIYRSPVTLPARATMDAPSNSQLRVGGELLPRAMAEHLKRSVRERQ